MGYCKSFLQSLHTFTGETHYCTHTVNLYLWARCSKRARLHLCWLHYKMSKRSRFWKEKKKMFIICKTPESSLNEYIEYKPWIFNLETGRTSLNTAVTYITMVLWNIWTQRLHNKSSIMKYLQQTWWHWTALSPSAVTDSKMVAGADPPRTILRCCGTFGVLEQIGLYKRVRIGDPSALLV